MAKVPKELMAFRLKPEAAKAVKYWAREDKVTQADVVEAAVKMYDESRVQPPVVPGAFTSPPQVSDAPFHPLCRHCGETFGAFNRHASVCPECKKDGHGGD